MAIWRQACWRWSPSSCFGAKWSGAIGLVWVFNIVGTVDLANALRHVDVVSGFGAVWYIPTMLVPLLLVTHFMMFARLVRGAGEGGWHAEFVE